MCREWSAESSARVLVVQVEDACQWGTWNEIRWILVVNGVRDWGAWIWLPWIRVFYALVKLIARRRLALKISAKKKKASTMHRSRSIEETSLMTCVILTPCEKQLQQTLSVRVACYSSTNYMQKTGTNTSVIILSTVWRRWIWKKTSLCEYLCLYECVDVRVKRHFIPHVSVCSMELSL